MQIFIVEISPRIYSFIEHLGHDPLLLTYPVRFKDRCVFQYSRLKMLRVCKIRPESEHSLEEFEKALAWFQFNFIQDFSYTSRDGLSALDMPWMGETLCNLENILSGYVTDEYYPSFEGFSHETVDSMISELTYRMHQFANLHGMVHNDLFAGAPNNILFLPGTTYLSIIDPEAFVTLSDYSWNTFVQHIRQVHEYMHDFLCQ